MIEPKLSELQLILNQKKKDIVSPGHVFPLVARSGGVLERAGHTEASVDISRLSKLNPSAVICEVMNEDGRMARLKDLKRFSIKHKIKIASIEDLIAYRLRNEKLVHRLSYKSYSFRRNEDLELLIYENKLNRLKNFVIKKGKLTRNKAIRVRVVSTRVKNIKKIFKAPKIKKSLNYLSRFNNFVLIVINNEKTDNVEKDNVILRYYGIGAQIIKDLKVKNMILVSRTKKKIIGLDGFGIKIKKQELIR